MNLCRRATNGAGLELFLLLSALLASLTGSVTTVVVPATGVARAERSIDARPVTREISARALVLVRAAAPVDRPDGYVAPPVFAPKPQPLTAVAPRAPERRRE